MKNSTNGQTAPHQSALIGVKSWADYEARARSILAEYGKGAGSRYQSARVIASHQASKGGAR